MKYWLHRITGGDNALAFATSPETIRLLIKGATVDGFKL